MSGAATGRVGDTTTGFGFKDYERGGTYVYVGYQNPTTGGWYIYRRTLSDNTRTYASGGSSYATNWTGRAGLSYV